MSETYLDLVVRSAGLSWQKSSFCSASSNNCLEAAVVRDGVLVRDSKGPALGVLGFGREHWQAFIESLRDGR